jgi:protein-tyrosine phosphatase
LIDLHAHLLPGVDDGPHDDAGTLALARAAVAAGTRELAATPHVDRGFGLDPHDIARRTAAVRELLAAHDVPLAVHAGGEIAYTRVPDLDDEGLGLLTLGGGGWLLLECPLQQAAGDLDPVVAHLQRRGFGVLLAHPERSPAIQRDPARLARLVSAGALAQVTASSFSGAFGQTVRRFSLELLRERLIHVVASDAHDAEHRDPALRPGLEAAARELPELDGELAWLVHAVPAAIVAGAEVPPRPPRALAPPRRRRFFARLRSPAQ